MRFRNKEIRRTRKRDAERLKARIKEARNVHSTGRTARPVRSVKPAAAKAPAARTASPRSTQPRARKEPVEKPVETTAAEETAE